MDDPGPDPGGSDEPGLERGSQGAPGVPRWVKVLMIAVAALALLLVALQIAGGQHGPGRHGASDDVRVAYSSFSGVAGDPFSGVGPR